MRDVDDILQRTLHWQNRRATELWVMGACKHTRAHTHAHTHTHKHTQVGTAICVRTLHWISIHLVQPNTASPGCCIGTGLWVRVRSSGPDKVRVYASASPHYVPKTCTPTHTYTGAFCFVWISQSKSGYLWSTSTCQSTQKISTSQKSWIFIRKSCGWWRMTFCSIIIFFISAI